MVVKVVTARSQLFKGLTQFVQYWAIDRCSGQSRTLPALYIQYFPDTEKVS